MELGLRVCAPSGSALLHDVATHAVANHTAAHTVARCGRDPSVPGFRCSVSFRAGWDKDVTMSSNTPASPDQPPAKKPAPPPKPGAKREEPAIAFTRAGALWSSLIAGFLILILLLVFITQNTETTAFTFLGWHWHLPLGVAILLAAVVGGLITVAVGTARILQLRRTAKKQHATIARQGR